MDFSIAARSAAVYNADMTTHYAALTRMDMVSFEARLCETLSRFFSFKTHALHFPMHEPDPEATYLADEDKLLLPLRFFPDEKNRKIPALGLFVAGGVRATPEGGSMEHILPVLPAISGLALENLQIYKQSLCDPLTGLYTREHLLSVLAKEITLHRSSLSPASYSQDENWPEEDSSEYARAKGSKKEERISPASRPRARGSVGVIAIRFNGLAQIVHRHGYATADKLLLALAAALLGHCPEQALAARSGEHEFTLLLPFGQGSACRDLAAEMEGVLKKIHILHDLTKKRINIEASFGYSIYPQDLDGVMARAPEEQARQLLRKARMAAAMAFEQPAALITQGPELRAEHSPIMGFGRILREGGRVIGPLPLGRYLIGLGRMVNAREGQRFAVWNLPPHPGGRTAQNPLYKGELVLVEVRENDALAELINSGDPAHLPEPGDRLLLLAPEETHASFASRQYAPRNDPSTGLLTHSEFMAEWSLKREKHAAFSLLLLRFKPVAHKEEIEEGTGGPAAEPEYAPEDAQNWEEVMGDVSASCLNALAELSPPEYSDEALGGRYGHNSLVFFLPVEDAEAVKSCCARLGERLKKQNGLILEAGIARHPFLDFRGSDAPENARKALEYAALLPAPHIGVTDSLALNINADRLFNHGDSFAATREYQRAVLADPKNTVAWNSLGICMASMGRPNEAIRHFKEALRLNPDDLMAIYNLGNLLQAGGDPQDWSEAEKLYLRCLELNPGHIYAMLRLGQVAERAKGPEEAKGWYLRAASFNRETTRRNDPEVENGRIEALIKRKLARLALKEGKEQDARELLHEALLNDPQDAAALQLLAQLYLEAGEDPQVAESLARQSVALRPDLKAGWLSLARALKASGKPDDASKALIKAEEC